MKALLLVGGKGTRLRPLTDRLPKPMVPVMGRPLLERTLETLRRHRVDEIVLSTCYKSECIRRYFGDGSELGLKIHYAQEDFPLGTGGAVKNAENYFTEPFFVLNADILSNIDFGEMMRFHRRKKAGVTIAVTQVKNPSAYGVIETDEDGYAASFREKPKQTASHLINAGAYVFDPDVLRRIPSGRAVSVEREVFPKLLEDGRRIAAYQGCDYWLDIGTPEKYVQAHRDAFVGKLRLPEVSFSRHAVYSRRNTQISGTALIRGPVYLGRDVRIMNGAVVGPYAVIGDDCIIGNQCEVSNCLLWNRVAVESGTKMAECIVTDDCRIQNMPRCRRMIYTPDTLEAAQDEAI